MPIKRLMDTNPIQNLPIPTSYQPIPIETLITLRKEKKLSYSQIAKVVGCSKANVIERLKPFLDDIDRLPAYLRHRSNIYALYSRRILQSLTDTDLQKANLRDKVLSAAILYDKERLERGQSTSNIAYVDMIKAKQSLSQELVELESKYPQLRDIDMSQVIDVEQEGEGG